MRARTSPGRPGPQRPGLRRRRGLFRCVSRGRPVTIAAAAPDAGTTADTTTANGATVTAAAAAAPVLATTAARTSTSTIATGKRSRRAGSSGLALTPPESYPSGGIQGRPLCRWWATARCQGEGKERGTDKTENGQQGWPLGSFESDLLASSSTRYLFSPPRGRVGTQFSRQCRRFP